ncbi:fumarylacetoacetase [Microtetraspora sp. NBRC 13810]|uniref:fumarylacetoacetase n=1 Tax=Microtetraspora sp. NBRC 13810 TaxID=3030990 RepID=UPI00249F9C06|nr:fumarylacetoacetase [Microtetraspora sp. NBRC 13810]GLW11916.1 fumarylacetoacetase [Microtetraspora sp. NBRC 13810]
MTAPGYGVEHLPYGIYARPGEPPRAGVRYGEHVLDLAAALADDVFAAPALNPFLARGRTAWRETRERLQELLTGPGAAREHLVPLGEVRLCLPFEVADYVDFYCSLEHATNAGLIFRPGQEPLPPNWRRLPVGYHGRAGTVVVSGTPVIRPHGQRGADDFGPSERLDFEAEVGFVVGAPSPMGGPAGAFEEHVFGVTLVNDWSARDVQAWETVPLGPFLGKSFATSVSPWVTPLDALSAARVPGREQSPEPLPYLRRTAPWGLDLALEIRLNGETVSRPPFRGMYWTPDQMLAHLTVNGASLRTGDLFAGGTVSGPEHGQRGSMLELSWNGAEPVKLPGGETRAFLHDGDVVTISATAPGPDGTVIALGEVSGTVRPAG